MTTKTLPSPKHDDQDVQHLFKAISKGKAHLTRFMLAASGSALMGCFNKEGRTPLMECCYIKEEVTRVTMVKTIRDAGADVNQKDENGRTALIHACQQRCNDVVRILIMHCQIIPDVEDIEGNTALIHSANNGNDIAVELLVRNFRRLGLQVDHFNKEGYTALHIAARNGFLQCAKILATKGKATLTLKDKVHNMTPLETCLENGYQKSEVDYLKPSVKFYKVAKLTTTMVKYRKRSSSGQDNIGSLASRISPAKAVDKMKQKSKSLLKKSKPQGNDIGDSSTRTLTQQKSLEQNHEKNPENCVDQDKQKSGIKVFSKKFTQRRQSVDGKSDGTKGPGPDDKNAGKYPPVIKIEAGNIKKESYKVTLPPHLSTSSSTDKDFDESGACGNCEWESAAAMDTNLLASDEYKSTSSSHPSAESCTNNLSFHNNNTSNKNNNKRGLQFPSNDIDRKYVLMLGEDDSGDISEPETECESVSDCTLPSMSPITQSDYTSVNNDTADDEELEMLNTKGAKIAFRKHSEKTGNDSCSPQTEVEYIHWDVDGSNTNQKSDFSNDAHCTDGNPCNSKVKFDEVVTGQVLKFIDDVTTSGFCDHNETDSGKMGFVRVTGCAKSGLTIDHKETINNVKVRDRKDFSKEGVLSIGRSDSCSPETIVESLDAMSIPKDVRGNETSWALNIQ